MALGKGTETVSQHVTNILLIGIVYAGSAFYLLYIPQKSSILLFKILF